MTDYAQTLYWEGIAKLPWSLSPTQVREFREHLLTYPVYQGHVKSQGDGVPKSFHESDAETLSYDMESVLTAPHFLEFALQDHIWDVAEAYLGQQPNLYSFNAFWTRP